MLEKIFFSLIRFEITGTELSEETKNLITDEVLPSLFQLARKHDLAHLVADALAKNGLLQNGSKAQKYFSQELNLVLCRYEQQNYELLALCEVLEGAKIPFIPLKGSVIRKFYPVPWMRTSCDIDILVKKEDLRRAIAVLEEKLNYKCNSIGSHDAQIYSPSGVHIELHFTLTKSNSKPALCALFESVWDYDKDSSSYNRKMENGINYCYLIAHMAGHIREGGCGVKPFLDVWLLNSNSKQDKSQLEKVGLLNFANAVESLSKVWFENKEPTELDLELSNYVLTGGVYGSMQNRVASKTSDGKKKTYLLSRIFMPYRELKYKYPKLQKHPILYPFYTVKRWFNLLNKETRNAKLKEFNEVKFGNDAEKNRIAKLLSDLDI